MVVAKLHIEGFSQVTEIGRGGSARVFSAFQEELDRVVAVKVLHSSWDEEVQQRFDRERRAMGRLSDHPGIVPIYATGKTETGEPYLVMPFYPRGSLSAAIAHGQPMPWQRATALIAAIAETMVSSHQHGIIHCDIKPANIMLHESGRPEIADFGISRSSDSVSISRAAALTFTPAYSPPEVFTNSSRAPTVDVYGMGATFYALLAGRPPFHAVGEKPDVMAIINRVAHQSLDDLRETVPSAICDFVERAMAKNPLNRPQNVATFLAELRAAVQLTQPGPGQVQNHLDQLVPESSILIRRPDFTHTSQDQAARPSRYTHVVSTGVMAATFVVAVLLGALLAYWGLDRSPPSDAQPTSPTTTASPLSTSSRRLPSTGAASATPSQTEAPVSPIKKPDDFGSATTLPDPRPEASPLPNESVQGQSPETREPTVVATPVISDLRLVSIGESSAVVGFETNLCTTAELFSINASISHSACSKSHVFEIGRTSDPLSPDTPYLIFVEATANGKKATASIRFTTLNNSG